MTHHKPDCANCAEIKAREVALDALTAMRAARYEDKVEGLKVWWALFGTIMDAHAAHEYTDAAALVKLAKLKHEIETRTGL